MDYMLLILGILIVLIVFLDMGITTIHANGDGFLTKPIEKGVWQLFLSLGGRKGNSGITEFAGLFSIWFIILFWILLFWLGHSLIFLSDPNSVIDDDTGEAATTLQKIYYTGYTLSTLGYGDYTPSGGFWKIYAPLISFTGFLIISNAVTYVIPVMGADTAKKQLSSYLSGLGKTPLKLLQNGWDGSSFKSLEPHFQQIIPMLSLHTQQIQAHTVIHNFHTATPSQSFTVNITVLNEALLALQLYVPDDLLPSKPTMTVLDQLLTDYTQALEEELIEPKENKKPILGADALASLGIPSVTKQKSGSANTESMHYRRNMLLAKLQHKGWDWEIIHKEQKD